MRTYSIYQSARTNTVPTVGSLYEDDDGDLFVYVGDAVNTWLEFSIHGSDAVRVRDASYPAEPLTEVPWTQFMEKSGRT